MDAKDVTMAYLEYAETDKGRKLYDAFTAGAKFAEKQLKKEWAEMFRKHYQHPENNPIYRELTAQDEEAQRAERDEIIRKTLGL